MPKPATLTLHGQQSQPASKPAEVDLSRQYGVVYGDPRVFFVQDGKQFDKSGKEIPVRK